LTIGTFILNANDLIALIVAPLAMIAVGLFLSKTTLGTAVRAAAERSDRAALLGIPVGWLSTVVWMLASVLSFLALFLRAGILGVPIGGALSISNLVLALAALVIGRLRNLPTIAVAAVALGILEYGIQWNADSPLLVAPFVGVAVMAALLLQRRGSTRLDQDTTASWRLADEVRALPREIAKLPLVRLMRWGTFALIGAAVVAIPLFLRTDQVIKVSAIFIYSIIRWDKLVSWRLVRPSVPSAHLNGILICPCPSSLRQLLEELLPSSWDCQHYDFVVYIWQWSPWFSH
jgi:branched-chain amino acid transport system permease protein